MSDVTAIPSVTADSRSLQEAQVKLTKKASDQAEAVVGTLIEGATSGTPRPEELGTGKRLNVAA